MELCLIVAALFGVMPYSCSSICSYLLLLQLYLELCLIVAVLLQVMPYCCSSISSYAVLLQLYFKLCLTVAALFQVKPYCCSYISKYALLSQLYVELYLNVAALYGVLFKDNGEAAFSNYRLWESIGFIVAFAYQSHLCLPIKAYILLAVLALGIAGYSIVEYIEWKKRRNSANVSK